jgi:hypothetical protein
MDDRVRDRNSGPVSKDGDVQANGWTRGLCPVFGHDQVAAIRTVSSRDREGTGSRFKNRLICHRRPRTRNRRLGRSSLHRQKWGDKRRRRGGGQGRQVAGENGQADQCDQQPDSSKIHAYRTRRRLEMFLVAPRREQEMNPVSHMIESRL